MKIVCLSALVFAMSVVPARADRITLGTLNGDGTNEPVSMWGQSASGFGFGGGASPFSGIWGASNCQMPICEAGSVVDLSARFVGLAITGSVLHEGIVHQLGINGAFLDLHWHHSRQACSVRVPRPSVTTPHRWRWRNTFIHSELRTAVRGTRGHLGPSENDPAWTRNVGAIENRILVSNPPA